MRASRLRAPLGEVDGGGSAGGDSDGPVQRQKHGEATGERFVGAHLPLAFHLSLTDAPDKFEPADYYLERLRGWRFDISCSTILPDVDVDVDVVCPSRVKGTTV